LNLTENWIAPQVLAVPDAEGAVLCDARVNADAFPLPPGRLFLDCPRTAWHWRLREPLARWTRAVGFNHLRTALGVRRWRPALVHAHFGTRGWESLPLASRLDVPLVTSFYGFDAWLAPVREIHWRERYRELFAAGTIFLVEGPAMAARLRTLECPAAKILVHRLGIDVSALSFTPRRLTRRLAVIMVGRFVEKKGLLDGLTACARARAAGLDVHVTIVGGPGRDAIGQQLQATLTHVAESPALRGTVRFAGFLPAGEMFGLIRAHDVFLCPSRHATNGDAEGGSPVILTEAMALGLSCIGTRHCDIPEVIVDGVTGVLCDEGDIDGLAAALVALAEDPDTAARMAETGRRHVEQQFSRSVQLAGLARIYQNVPK
jgi:colanic acid/amylovoran biosynthesis glycosyltransferase